MQLDSKEKFSTTTIALHWIVGLTIIALLATGIYMEENEVYALYPWHKSFGVLIVAFVLARWYWRFKNGWPVPVGTYSKMEIILSKVIHHALLLVTLLMPLSGALMSVMGGHGIAVFGLELIPANFDAVAQKTVPLNAPLAKFAHSAHGVIGNIAIACILLHVVGSLKHHLVDKDGTLRRMLGARV